MNRVRRYISGDSLRGRLLSGAAWLGSGSFSEQAARLGRNMLLTRLLVPEAFGTMAIVLSVSSAVDAFTEIGVKEALIQNPKGSSPEMANAAWWIAVLRTILLYLFLFLTAPHIAHFYGYPQITGLLRVALLGIPLNGAISAGAYLAIKEMRFSRWAWINHGGAVAGVMSTIVIALVRRDIWAIAIGALAETAFRCLLSYLLCSFRPRLGFDWECARELLHFSRRAFGLPILSFIFTRSDIFVLGKLFAAGTLGLYSMAINIVQVPSGFILNLLGQLLMPAFVRLQDDDRKLKSLLLRVTALIASIGLPAVSFAILASRQILTVVYGQRYSGMATVFSLGAAAIMVNVLNAQITTVFYAKGLPNLHRRAVAITATVMAVLVYPFVRLFGVVGAPVAVLVAAASGYVFQVARIKDLTGLSYREYARRFAPALALASCVVAVNSGIAPFFRFSATVVSVVPALVGITVAYVFLLTTPLRHGITLSHPTD